MGRILEFVFLCLFRQESGSLNSQKGICWVNADGQGPYPGPSTFAEVQRGSSSPFPPTDGKSQMAQKFDVL